MPIALLFCLFSLGPSPIVIDGRFDDWSEVPVRLNDPADAPEAAVDFGELRVTHDDRFVHLLVDFGKVVNPHHLRGTARLLLDADGDARTGEALGGLDGVDVVVELTPPHPDVPGGLGRGVGLRVIGAAEPLSPYEIGFSFGPSWASRRFELRLQRRTVLAGAPPFLAGERFSSRLEFADDRGQLLDRTDPFTHELSPVDPRPGNQLSDPLGRRPRTALRVVSWNVNFGGLFRQPELFGRILRALDPDVILFQEIHEDTAPQQLVEFLRRWVVGGGRSRRAWNALIGAAGGDLRTAVAARVDLEAFAPLRRRDRGHAAPPARGLGSPSVLRMGGRLRGPHTPGGGGRAAQSRPGGAAVGLLRRRGHRGRPEPGGLAPATRSAGRRSRRRRLGSRRGRGVPDRQPVQRDLVKCRPAVRGGPA
jgi:hypothetical protein